MKNDNPCANCDRKGCGSYHDECLEYQEWKQKERDRWLAIREDRKFNGRGYIKPSTYKSRVRKRV